MHYLFFSTIFFISIFLGFLSIAMLVFRKRFSIKFRKKFTILLTLWFIPYFVFVFFFAGPRNVNEYPDSASSPYKLPWEAGVTRFVAQGNNSFTTHRGLHYHAWDFMMANGTTVLAAREGVVDKVVQNFDGIGFNSNYIHIRHEDGSVGGYAHIEQGSALIKTGQNITQGQPIASSGMVGETIMPHLHFYVLNKEKTESIPISFKDVEGGVPLAGHFYTSDNQISDQMKSASSLNQPENSVSFISSEPEIQCTILEVKKDAQVFGRDLEQYDSISNDATRSKLSIANEQIDLKPQLIKKEVDFERIEISKENQRLILNIHGKPISRNGTLELNGEQIAKITCH